MNRLFGPAMAFGFALAVIAGASFAQTPGAGPNVYGAGNYGPPLTATSGHIGLGGAPAPTINASCGTGAVAPVGTDGAFFFTTGTSSNSGCQITPNTPYKARPICSVDAQGATQPAFSVNAVGTITMTPADSTTYNVICFNQPGG